VRGWARKKAHMIALALIAVLCGPRREVTDLGRGGPPGHSWPSPAIEYRSTAEPPAQFPYAISATPSSGSDRSGPAAHPLWLDHRLAATGTL